MRLIYSLIFAVVVSLFSMFAASHAAAQTQSGCDQEVSASIEIPADAALAQSLAQDTANAKASQFACGYGKCTFNSDCCGGDCHFGQCAGKSDRGGRCGYGKCTFNSDCCGGDCHFGQCAGKSDRGGRCGYDKCTFNSDCCGGDCYFGQCRGRR